ncbi:Alpha/Beta hydrolase protein [Hyaloraphidium curvatum]|nr:Alpha/Beta hydrolase protein [Hyaloraphidium curvatum]
MPTTAERVSYVAAGTALAFAGLYAFRALLPTVPAPGLPKPDDPAFADLSPADRALLERLYPADALPGSHYAWLSRGRVHFNLFKGGKAADPLSPPDSSDEGMLVIVHGISTPSPPYAEVLSKISASRPNLLVLIFDHYGRGRTDGASNGGPYDLKLYGGMLDELLSSLPRAEQHFKNGFTALGISMGGPVAAHYAVTRPERVKQLALVAPAGLLAPSGGLSLLSTPYLGAFLVDNFTPILAAAFKSRGGYSAAEAAMHPAVRQANELQDLQMRLHKGYTRALLRSVSDGVVSGQEETFRKLADRPYRTLVIWGTEDTVVPYELHRKLLALAPNAELVSVEGAGHDVFMSDPERMVELVGRLFQA